jgi:hypothetical protein
MSTEITKSPCPRSGAVAKVERDLEDYQSRWDMIDGIIRGEAGQIDVEKAALSSTAMSAILRLKKSQAESAKVERDLGDYQLRLAGALMAAEGSTSAKTIATAVEPVRTCPTIRAVLQLRQDRDDLRDALGKAEQEIIRIKTRPPGTNKKSKSKPLSRSKKVPGRRAPSGRSRKKTTRKRLAAVRQ